MNALLWSSLWSLHLLVSTAEPAPPPPDPKLAAAIPGVKADQVRGTLRLSGSIAVVLVGDTTLYALALSDAWKVTDKYGPSALGDFDERIFDLGHGALGFFAYNQLFGVQDGKISKLVSSQGGGPEWDIDWKLKRAPNGTFVVKKHETWAKDIEGEPGSDHDDSTDCFDGIATTTCPKGSLEKWPDVETIEWKYYASASSTLVESSNKRLHAPDAAVDDRDETAWCEGVPGHGVGEWLKVELKSSQALKSVRVTPGFGKSQKLWVGNNRLKRAKLTASDGTSTEAHFDDKMEEQTIPFVTKGPVDWVKLEIEEVYPGKADDTCISSLDFQ